MELIIKKIRFNNIAKTQIIMKFKITTDLTPRQSKPQLIEVGAINNSMKVVVETDLEGLSEMMEKGYTFSPSLFENNKRSNKNWLQQQVFALDFDSGVTPEKVIECFDREGLKPNMIYTSFSDSPELRKFRVLFLLDTPIKDKEDRDYFQKTLMNLSGESDEACKDASRMYFGGKESYIIDQTPYKIDRVFEIINLNEFKKAKEKKKAFKPISQKGERNIDTITLSNLRKETKLHSNIDLERVREEVKIFNDFVGGEWLTHPQLFGLATSLIWIKGGLKLMKETMLKYNQEGKTNYTDNNFAILPYVKKMNYQPQRLQSYSPYESDWEHTNLITSVRMAKGQIEIVNVTKKIPLKVAEDKMEEEFQRITKEDNNKIYIFKLPCAIGKTRLLETVPFTIALPTNDLKDEVYDRVVVDKIKTPTFPKLEDESLNKKINHLYNIGMDKMATKLISKIAKSQGKYSKNDVEAVSEYLNTLRKCYVFNNTVVTTHKRAMLNDFQSPDVHKGTKKFKTLVFDEDPLQSILEVDSFTIGQLTSIEGQRDLFSSTSGVSAFIDCLRDVKLGQLIPTPKIMVELEKIIEDFGVDNMESNLLSIIKSKFIIRDSKNANYFHYITENKIPEDKKVIIMSATASIPIYKQLYGDRLEVIDITNVEQKGKVVQNTKFTCSKMSLEANFSKIMKEVNTNLPSITHKSYINKIPNASKEMYFYNTSGYDTLKGQNINVIGTPNCDKYFYALIAAVANIDVPIEEYEFINSKVIWNNYKFNFYGFINKKLREIQLSIIEGELIQAIGRARALRENCTVFVYCGIPMYVTDEFVY